MVFRLLSAFSALFLAFAACAQDSPVEGVNYIELKPPQAVESSGKVEVLEFFWYRCPHCYSLEPDLESWAKRLPRDVQRSEEHTSELQSLAYLVCRLLLEKKKNK